MATTESAATTTDSEPLGALYRVKFVVGNDGMRGVPLMHVEALVNARTGAISGHAQMTQEIAAPNGNIVIDDLTGQIRDLGRMPERMRVVTLSGSYARSVPPPATGAWRVPVSAMLGIEQDEWVGRGWFAYGNQQVDDVPVSAED